MRRARLKVSADRAVGYYHCLSRVVDRRFRLGELEKEQFVRFLREYEEFCEVRVLTYCVMSNHFHVLVAVPQRPKVLPSAEELIAKLRRLSAPQDVGAVQQRLALYREAHDVEGERVYLETFYARLWDLSLFMKSLKQRFTQWYNTRTERKGTLWEERFKSVVVEGAGRALGAMAAYIDLNPVRAGLAPDPQDYRWSGYGAAMAGDRRAKEGLRKVIEGMRGGAETLSGAMAAYRMHLYREGSEEQEAVDAQGRPGRGALKRSDVLKVLQAKGKLQLSEYLRCRVRYFCDGAVLGSKEFVEEIFQTRRGWFGQRRKSGARQMRGLDGDALFTARNLRLQVFG
jgi:putative transposase